MERITVVIEGATAPVSLGMELAGGRVVAASEEDQSVTMDQIHRLADFNDRLIRIVRKVLMAN